MTTLATGSFRGPKAGFWRWLSFAVVGLGLVWTVGLILFAGSLPREVEDADSMTDAIVVLTGGSRRVSVGLELLASGHARKLFISGVHSDVVKAEIAGHEPKLRGLLSCCVSLGYSASDTVGNAAESASWMAKEGFRSLRLVTSGYHMPRSLIEFRRALPHAAIVANPVFPSNVRQDAWWRWPGTAELIASEFNKFLFAWLRSSLSGLWAHERDPVL
ncbi:MAG: YdcF family protein [Proteobacteria bacterium]|nr:YdcF family protein [Pseudomonadota bacterium]MBI3499399.1 YdcF family protein [Pseudomonadota bacterium]